MKKYKLKDGVEMHKLRNGDILVQNDEMNDTYRGIYKPMLTRFLNGETKYIEFNPINGEVVNDFFEEVKDGYYNHFRLNKPEIDEPYYYMDSFGSVSSSKWQDGNIDNYRWNNNICFDNKKTTETFIKNNDRFAPLLKKMEIEFAKGGEIEHDKDGTKYSIYYDNFRECMSYYFVDSTQYDDIYCNEQRLVRGFIKENEEELKAYFEWMQEYNSWKGEK